MKSGKLIGGPKNQQQHIGPDDKKGVIFTDKETKEKHHYLWDEAAGTYNLILVIDRRNAQNNQRGHLREDEWESIEMEE